MCHAGCVRSCRSIRESIRHSCAVECAHIHFSRFSNALQALLRFWVVSGRIKLAVPWRFNQHLIEERAARNMAHIRATASHILAYIEIFDRFDALRIV